MESHTNSQNPDSLTKKDYEKILRRYTPKENDSLTEEEFNALRKTQNFDLLREKTFNFIARDLARTAYADGMKLEDFEDLLSDTYIVMLKFFENAKQRNWISEKAQLKSYKSYAKFFVAKRLKDYSEMFKHANWDLNFPEVVSLEGVEGEIEAPESEISYDRIDKRLDVEGAIEKIPVFRKKSSTQTTNASSSQSGAQAPMSKKRMREEAQKQRSILKQKRNLSILLCYFGFSSAQNGSVVDRIQSESNSNPKTLVSVGKKFNLSRTSILNIVNETTRSLRYPKAGVKQRLKDYNLR